MHKRCFTLTLQSEHAFPDDLYNDSDMQESLQEHMDNLEWHFPGDDIKKVWVTIEEILKT